MFDKFTDRSRRVMGLARQEAQNLGHEYIGTEHLLLGLIKEGGGNAANNLKLVGLTAEKIEAEIRKLVQTNTALVTDLAGKLPFTPRAKSILKLAEKESKNQGVEYIGTEHILAGLLQEGENVAYQVMMNLGARLDSSGNVTFSVNDELIAMRNQRDMLLDALSDVLKDSSTEELQRTLPSLRLLIDKVKGGD